jgi:hypothetical protein
MTLNEQHCLHFAMRYALGRRSTAPGIVVREIVHKWSRLNQFAKTSMHKEINNAIERNEAGDGCDVAEWQKILELPI